MGILGGYVKRYLHLLYLQEGKEGVGTSGCCVVVPGTTIRGIAVLHIVTTTTRTTGTTTGASVLLSPPRALFCARVGVWECVERAKKESRPAPVMSVSQRYGRVSLRRRLRTQRVTISEDKTGLGRLVGGSRKLAQLYTIAGILALLIPRGDVIASAG